MNISKTKTIITIFLILLCSVQGISQDKVKIVFLAGQSNMAGAGNFDALDLMSRKRVAEAAKRVMLSISGKQAKPLSAIFSAYQLKKRGFGNCFGPELFLGVKLAEKYPNDKFLFIKTSQGGTFLYGAWNPEWSAEKAKLVEEKEFKQKMKLYSLHQSHIRANLERLTKAGKSYEIIGMVWMQGENDASREVSARSYNENLTKLIAGYRNSFSLNEMPFVAGQINSTYGNFDDGPKIVREAFVQVAKADSFVDIVPSSTDPSWSDFPKHTDNVHYNAEGQKRLGEQFFNALMRLQK